MKHHRKNVDAEFQNPAAIFYSLLHELFLFKSQKRLCCVTRRQYVKPLHQLDSFFLVFFWKLAAWRKHFDVLENEMRQNLLYELYETEVGSRNTHLRRIYDQWMLAKLEFWKLVLAFVFGLFKQINRTQMKVIIIHVIVLLGMFYLP